MTWLLSLGCITLPGEYADLREQAMDADGDGQRSVEYPGGTDCDDQDPDVYDGAPELCSDTERVDEDCDGKVDEGIQHEWYFDEDGDGWFSDLGYAGCDPGVAGSSTDQSGGDCDDTDPAVNPDQTELAADGVDQDCDDAELCYEDLDGDGYGAGSVESADLSCVGDGESENGDDCDDSDAAAFPDAPEVAADGVDQDCDGGDDCYVDLDGDGFAGSQATSDDMDCDDAGESSASPDCVDGDVDVSSARRGRAL